MCKICHNMDKTWLNITRLMSLLSHEFCLFCNPKFYQETSRKLWARNCMHSNSSRSKTCLPCNILPLLPHYALFIINFQNFSLCGKPRWLLGYALDLTDKKGVLIIVMCSVKGSFSSLTVTNFKKHNFSLWLSLVIYRLSAKRNGFAFIAFSINYQRKIHRKTPLPDSPF